MSKPKFDPKKPFEVVSAKKPAFDPSQPFEAVGEESGPSRIKETISQYARPVLEMGGALAGGSLGVGATAVTVGGVPAGAAIGGALGFGAGKSAADLLDRTMGLKERPTIGEGIQEIGKNLSEGVAAELTGQLAGAGAKALAESGAPIVKTVVDKAKKFAVDMTPAEITKSKPWAMLESALEKVPFSSGIIQRFRVKQGAQLEKAAQDLIENLATVESRDVTGTAAQKAIETKFYKRLKVRDKLFDRLAGKVDDNTPIETDNIKALSEELFYKEIDRLPVNQKEEIFKTLDQFNKAKFTFRGIKGERERLNDLVGRIADTPEKKIYQKIKGALDLDVAAFAEKSGGEVAKAWKKANAFHGAIKQLAEDSNIKSILAKSQPEKIVDALISSKSTTQMRLLRKAMPESAYQNVQGALVARLFEGGPNQSAANALNTNLAKYGEDFLEAAITKPKLDRLKEFAEVVSATKGAEKLAGNPSGTAQNLISVGYGAFLITNPVKGAVTVVAPPVLAKIYLSDFGKKLITEGVKISPQSARAGGIASALLALSKKEQNAAPQEKKEPGQSLLRLPKGNLNAEEVSLDKDAYRKGLQSFNDGDYEKAASMAVKALKINPSFKEALRLLERSNGKMGKG